MIIDIDNFQKQYGFDPSIAAIKLNAEEVKHVARFNAAEGWIERYVMNDSGEYKVNVKKDDFEKERCLAM